MFRIICLVVGYFIGCIQTAYFVSKSLGVDLRTQGSGNLGTTNAMRILGKKAGAITFLGDLMKSIIAFLIFSNIYKDNSLIAGMYASFGVILGHDFPFFLRFKGGKGIAAMIGMLFCLGIKPIAIIVPIGIFVLAFGYVSLASLTASLLLPIALFIFGYPTEAVILSSIICVLAFIKHRTNIVRLLNKTENRINFWKKRGV